MNDISFMKIVKSEGGLEKVDERFIFRTSFLSSNMFKECTIFSIFHYNVHVLQVFEIMLQSDDVRVEYTPLNMNLPPQILFIGISKDILLAHLKDLSLFSK